MLNSNNKTKVSEAVIVERIVNILHTFVDSNLFDLKTMVIEVREDDSYWHDLQDYVCSNLRQQFFYATGDSVLNAAFEIAESQIVNGYEELINE